MTTGAAVLVYIYVDCEQNGDTSKHSPGRALQPLGRCGVYIDCEQNGDTLKQKRLCSLTDDFPLNGYSATFNTSSIFHVFCIASNRLA